MNAIPALRDFCDVDFTSLMDLWHATGIGNPKRGDSLEAIRRTLDAGARLLVMVQGGRVIASAWLTDDARRLYVHHVAVHPEAQGQGYSKSLMDEAVKTAEARGLRMKLEVHAANERAIALYRKYGFEDIGDYRTMVRY
jgi:ribosomal protein S18 acetylase RimI-like enzyme